MSQHTPILMTETSLSPSVLVHSTPQKRRRMRMVGWGGVMVVLGWLVLFVG